MATPAQPAAPSELGPEDARDTAHLQNEEDLPTDGGDPEGERMIEALGEEPHLQKPLQGS